MKTTVKGRALFACFCLVGCFGIFVYRLCVLQIERHEELSQVAEDKHVTRKVTYANRGQIVDCNNEILADNQPVQTVVVDCTLIKDKQAFAAIVSGPLKMKAKEVFAKIDNQRRYVVLKREVSEEATSEITSQLALRSLHKGLILEPEHIRIYPNGTMLCHVLGFLNNEYAGVQGIEKTMNEYLDGQNGFLETERDANGNELVQFRGREYKPHNGCTVRLTIDMGLQNIVETELQAAYAQYKPKMALAILMRPQTGEILAMANRPNFDPAQVEGSTNEAMKNVSVISMMEPGSTFKIVTAAAALNEKKVKLDSTIFCENGHFNYAGKVLHDHHPYGELTVADILVKSSNVGAAKLAMLMGESKFYEYIRSFGFGERTGVALPGEINGVVHPVQNWSKISISRIPMGQGVGVTAIQTAAAMSVIANGGSLMMPQIVRDITDEDGKVVKSFEPVKIRQTISPEVAKLVTTALKDVVSERGTAVGAKVPGFTVAGKTGTASIPNPKGGYFENKYVVSFVGFMPADDPQFVAIVALQEPVVKAEAYYGGTVSAPVFAKIAEKAARYLNLQPEQEVPATSVALTKAGTLNKQSHSAARVAKTGGDNL